MTLVELLVGITIIAVLLGLAVTSLRRAKVAGNEASAISSLRVIRSAQFAYAATCGGGRFATSLPILGARSAKAPYPFLNEDLGAAIAPIHSGYQIHLAAGLGGTPTTPDCAGNPTMSQYYASATPLGNEGTRAYGTNEKGLIYYLQGDVPPTEPFGPPAKAVQ